MTNKALLFLLALSLSACSIFKKGPDTPPPTIYSFSEEITKDRLYNDLAVLAHDSLQGRETGTIGEEKAARYLSKRYAEIGLKPVGDDNSYFQHYELTQPAVEEVTYRLADGDEVVDNSTHNAQEIGNFVTLFGGSDTVSGPVVFAGAGMYNEAEGINHFPEDVSGKWLFVLYERSNTNMQYLQRALTSGGAVGTILIVGTDTTDFLQEAKTRQNYFGRGQGLNLKYLQEDDGSTAPAFNRVHPELGARMLGLENLEALAETQRKILEEPASFQAKPLEGQTLYHNPVVNENTVHTKNVVALLEGSDPELKNEVVVLSAHYDHVGVGQPDSTGDNIYNGADDDGSGTVATLHTAQAMAEAKAAGVGPKRSVLFLSVSGEEKGLLGSRYYSDHPIFSIENTVANINIDMIGRVDPEHQNSDSSYVYIIGGKIISSQMDSLTQMANVMGPNLVLSDRYNDLEDPNQFYRRSDHWNFGRLGVPFVFFFNGTHEDYHRPQDHIEKITFEPYLKRTKLVYNLTALLANSPDRPQVDNQEFIEKTQVDPR
ncbi:MAG: M28 family peptidase [Gracilimonas sp.]|uniref:M28 family peptidase n=1 Tax=Gracilimonas TaxID=649462 RepID=UPI001B2848ED|nr:M28 family peptidase [Gracilimonas sp.]MBO6584726.1 M28 family peptidase [Gracilimonas sp.]MBO6616003.1 M28 family peptidase [Gracilimonas sp.]